MSPSLVGIDRLPLVFVAVTAPERAERLGRHVRDAVASSLPGALAAACGPALDEQDGYVFIDRLQAQCAVGSHWDDEAIGRALAGAVATQLLRGVAAGGTIAFRDRAEFVAAFVAALVDGHAFSRWWFQEFDGLAPLTPSSALRTLIATEAETAVQALARLTTDGRRRAVALLTAADAQRALGAVVASRGDGGALGSLTDVMRVLAADGTAAALGDPQRELIRIVALESVRPGAAGRAALLTLDAVDRLERAARDGRLGELLLGAGPPSDLIVTCAERLTLGPDRIGVLGALDAAALLDHLRALAPAEAATQPAAAAAGELSYTPYGGAVMLAALLVRLDWWTRPDQGRWALAVVARALHTRRRGAVTRDPVLRALFGVAPGPPAADDPPRPPARGVRVAADALLAELAARMPGCIGSTPSYLRAQCLDFPAVVAGDEASIRARVGRAPLDVLVTLSGLKRATVTLPGGRVLSITEDPSW